MNFSLLALSSSRWQRWQTPRDQRRDVGQQSIGRGPEVTVVQWRPLQRRAAEAAEAARRAGRASHAAGGAAHADHPRTAGRGPSGEVDAGLGLAQATTGSRARRARPWCTLAVGCGHGPPSFLGLQPKGSAEPPQAPDAGRRSDRTGQLDATIIARHAAGWLAGAAPTWERFLSRLHARRAAPSVSDHHSNPGPANQ